LFIYFCRRLCVLSTFQITVFMLKRVLLYITVMVILLLVAISAGQWDKDTTLLQEHSDEIGVYLEKQEAEALRWFHGIQADLLAKRLGNDWEGVLQQQAREDYTILIHRSDSILWWSNSKALPGKTDILALRNLSGRKLLHLPLGYFLAFQEKCGVGEMTVLVPVRFTLDAQSTHPFPANPVISGEINVSETTTPYPVLVGGKTFCWLDAAGPVQSRWLQWIQLLFYGLFFIVLLTLSGKIAGGIAERYGRPAGAVLPLLVATGVMALSRHFNFFSQTFDALPLFTQKFDSPSLIGNSLGDWLINICLLVWLMLLFHRAFRIAPAIGAPPALRYVHAGLSYLLNMGSVLFGIEIFRQLVFHSRIPFDFDNILNLHSFSLVAIGGLLLLMLSLFIFSHRMMISVRDAGLPQRLRFGLMAGAALVYAILCVARGEALQINLFFVIAFGIVYTFLFDAYTHWEAPGFGWIVCWLLLFSLFSSSLLYRYNYVKGERDRLEYAEALVMERDTAIAEKLLPTVTRRLKGDSAQLNILLKPWPFKASAAELRDHFNALIFDRQYLFQHYRLTVYAFDRENQPMLLGQTGDYNFAVDNNWKQGVPLPNAPDVRFHTDADGKSRYMLQIKALRMSDLSQPATVYCFFDHEYPKPTRVYAQLFYNTPYKNLSQLRYFDFAVRKNGKLVVEQGQANLAALHTALQNGEGRIIETENPYRLDAVFKSPDGQTVATVGRRAGGWYKQVYLFSVLFTLSSLLLFVLALLNSYLRFLPDYFQFRLSVKGSLAKRIHFWNVTLIGTAFLVIGFMTYRHFTAASRETERANLDFRADAVLTNLKIQLVNSSLSADSLRHTLPKNLSTIATSLSMDANLYGPDGSLEFTTQQDLAGLGVLSPKMNAVAWEVLRKGQEQERVASEQTAGFEYFTKYLPLLNDRSQVLGFLGVPYQLTERVVGSEVSDFIGILASLYVFLLLIAYAVTFLLARSIIKPISLISDKIKVLRLEDKNVPLEYKGDAQDELSELIAQYNRMVDKLEHSKVELIRLEREGAWREMAKQVAHDIKNPLTTMKLSMQQLERVSSDPEQAAAYLRKAITRLIEQIDSLAQIASEFSMFANLDIREKHDMVINEVVESVHDLFSEQKNVDLELQLAKERFHIVGDKNHLIRVFNNLVINAIQSISSERRGCIKVSIYRDGGMVVIQISDNGGGIPAEIQQRVFEPNFTTKTSGSGLGLAICRKIIEAHDGTIRFETRENEGTDFFVEMPIVKQ